MRRRTRLSRWLPLALLVLLATAAPAAYGATRFVPRTPVANSKTYQLSLDYQGDLLDILTTHSSSGQSSTVTSLKFDESREEDVTVKGGGAFFYKPGPATVTASGSITCTGSDCGTPYTCTIKAGPNAATAAPQVQAGNETVVGTKHRRTITVDAILPASTDSPDQQVVVLGSAQPCVLLTTRGGGLATSSDADPTGQLIAATNATMTGVDIDDLPQEKKFPVNLTGTSSVGSTTSTDHLTFTGTETVAGAKQLVLHVFVDGKDETGKTVDVVPGKATTLAAKFFKPSESTPTLSGGTQPASATWTGLTGTLAAAKVRAPSWDGSGEDVAGVTCGSSGGDVCVVGGYSTDRAGKAVVVQPSELRSWQVPSSGSGGSLYFLNAAGTHTITVTAKSGDQTATRSFNAAFSGSATFKATTCPVGIVDQNLFFAADKVQGKGITGLRGPYAVPGSTASSFPPPAFALGMNSACKQEKETKEFGFIPSKFTVAPAGIIWEGSVTGLPTGSVAIAQLWARNAGVTLPSLGPLRLDNFFPLWRADNASTVEGRDSPGTSLGLRRTGTLAMGYKFATFLMYRPPGADSIWVAVAQMSWSFMAVAECKVPHWTIKSSTPPGREITGSFFSGEPEWSANEQNTGSPPDYPTPPAFDTCGRHA